MVNLTFTVKLKENKLTMKDILFVRSGPDEGWRFSLHGDILLCQLRCCVSVIAKNIKNDGNDIDTNAFVRCLGGHDRWDLKQREGVVR